MGACTSSICYNLDAPTNPYANQFTRQAYTRRIKHVSPTLDDIKDQFKLTRCVSASEFVYLRTLTKQSHILEEESDEIKNVLRLLDKHKDRIGIEQRLRCCHNEIRALGFAYVNVRI